MYCNVIKVIKEATAIVYTKNLSGYIIAANNSHKLIIPAKNAFINVKIQIIIHYNPNTTFKYLLSLDKNIIFY